MQNPFQYGKVVSEPYFTDREQELETLIQDVSAHHNVVLHSPRRYGKTSLLFKLAENMRERGYTVLYLDFFRVNSRANFIELYSREIFKQSGKNWKATLKKIGILARGIRPVVTIDALGNPAFSLTFESQNLNAETLESVLNLTENLDPKKQWLVIFDEFQELANLNGDNFENILRSVIQQHTRSTYIFSGSRYHLLLDIFNQPGRAFYHFGKIMQLDKIDPSIMRGFIVQRFKDTGLSIAEDLAGRIVSQAGNIPNYVQFLAAELWQLAVQASSTPDSAMLGQALEKMLTNLAEFFQQIWSGLSLQQKKILTALSRENTRVFSQDYHERHRLGATSTSQRAVQKLLAEQLISQADSGFEFCDPLFLLFIQSRIAI